MQDTRAHQFDECGISAAKIAETAAKFIK
jgi:hypothetical protein